MIGQEAFEREQEDFDLLVATQDRRDVLVVNTRRCFAGAGERVTLGGSMGWLHHVVYFFGGAFCANALPHLMAGVAGKSMPTPFASPPFRGQSSPVVNVAWALVNLLAAYALLGHVGDFDIERWSDAGVSFFGFAVMALLCARSMARLNGARA